MVHAPLHAEAYSRTRGFFSPSQLLPICKSRIRPSLEYCFLVWGSAPKSSLRLLDTVQFKAIQFINCPNLTNFLQSRSHRPLISIFYRNFSRTLLSGDKEYYFGSSEMLFNHQNLYPFTHLSKLCYLIHEF